MQRLQPFVQSPRASFDLCSAEEYEAAPKLDLAAIDAKNAAAECRNKRNIDEYIFIALLVIALS